MQFPCSTRAAGIIRARIDEHPIPFKPRYRFPLSFSPAFRLFRSCRATGSNNLTRLYFSFTQPPGRFLPAQGRAMWRKWHFYICMQIKTQRTRIPTFAWPRSPRKAESSAFVIMPVVFLIMTFNQRDVPRFVTRNAFPRVSVLSLERGLSASIRRKRVYARARARACICNAQKAPDQFHKPSPQDLRASKNVAHVVSAKAARAAESGRLLFRHELARSSALGNSINHLRYNRLKLNER